MYRVSLPKLDFFAVWRDAARTLASHEIPPEDVLWDRGEDIDLFEAAEPPTKDGAKTIHVPADFPKLAETVLCHSDPVAPSMLYQAIYRHQNSRSALKNPADPLSRRIERLAKSVRRDIHKMHAFVRFRELESEGDRRRFGAWFEPDHSILETATPFFARRFGDMDWMISTPQGVARFEQGNLLFFPAAERPTIPDDASEELWSTYFASIFNPARLHLKAMRSEMPKKYWKNLPETRLIPEMLAEAETRVASMRAAMPTEVPLSAERILSQLPQAEMPENPQTMPEVQAAAMHCRRCDLCEAATQTVWGEGDPTAPLMIVGEQPGDAEDLAGRPFVGPAGQLLRRLLAETDIENAYLTNAVKHFKFRLRGKKRLHQNPNRGEISHCRWWLDIERRIVEPQLTIALGASAAYALTGNRAAMRERRGKVELAQDNKPVLVTWHPSYILRLPGDEQLRAREQLSNDLAQAATVLTGT